jgi:transposase
MSFSGVKVRPTPQQINIKFLVKLGKSGNEIREMFVEVYGDNAIKKTAVYKWVKRFSEGRGSVTGEERSGQPATSITEEKIAKFRQIVRENRRLTVMSIAEQVNINREAVMKILTEDLDMRKVCAISNWNVEYFVIVLDSCFA